MPSTVWKSVLHLVDEQTINLPASSKILTFQIQNGCSFIWYLVPDTSAPLTPRRFRLAGTGHPLSNLPHDNPNLSYIATAHPHPFVWHLFEILLKPPDLSS